MKRRGYYRGLWISLRRTMPTLPRTENCEPAELRFTTEKRRRCAACTIAKYRFKYFYHIYLHRNPLRWTDADGVLVTMPAVRRWLAAGVYFFGTVRKLQPSKTLSHFSNFSTGRKGAPSNRFKTSKTLLFGVHPAPPPCIPCRIPAVRTAVSPSAVRSLDAPWP